MQQSQNSLYLKTSSIYNKIMQLAIAIVFIIILMNMWIASGVNERALISDYFDDISNRHLKQASSSLQLLMVDSDPELIQQTIDELAKIEFVKSVHLYDETGQVLFSSAAVNFSPDSINDLYGISPYKLNVSANFVPFLQEIRTDKLLGYLRLTIEKDQLSRVLNEASDERQKLLRLMLILAGLVGFLLTRGFNRFSRQGYRIPQKKFNS